MIAIQHRRALSSLRVVAFVVVSDEAQRTDHDVDAMINKYKYLRLRFSLFTILISTPGPGYRLQTCSMAPLEVCYQFALVVHHT